MQTTTAGEWNKNPTRAAWLWVETGEGQLLPVRHIRADWWIVTGTGWATNSWCCHPGTRLYIGTPEEAKGQESVLQSDLAKRREQWSSKPFVTLA